jgi:2,4-dienoyl-CoA reductase-like NADH-dependent reductase (Old Yellow Enzyme family)
MSTPLLFTPLTLRGLTLKNRVVVAPMHQYAGVKGFPTDWHLMNAGRYAAGGAGLVIVESTKIERRGCGTVGDLGLWDDAFIPQFARIVDLIHLSGAAAGIQLGHSGRKSRTGRPWEGGKPLQASADIDDWDGWQLVAPSALPADSGSPVPHALTLAEIGEVVERWGKAAARAQRAGFDVVEIHGAHGFLIHQFLSPRANQRTDAYGGSDENRMRFALEVAESVRANWPDDKPLFMRLSVDDDAGWSPAHSVELARLLKQRGRRCDRLQRGRHPGPTREQRADRLRLPGARPRARFHETRPPGCLGIAAAFCACPTRAAGRNTLNASLLHQRARTDAERADRPARPGSSPSACSSPTGTWTRTAS